MHHEIYEHLEDVLSGAPPFLAASHLKQCQECRDEVHSMQAQAALVRQWKASAEVEPRAGFYARVWSESTRKARSPSGTCSWSPPSGGESPSLRWPWLCCSAFISFPRNARQSRWSRVSRARRRPARCHRPSLRSRAKTLRASSCRASIRSPPRRSRTTLRRTPFSHKALSRMTTCS